MKKYQLFIGIDISKKTIDVSLSTNGQKANMIHEVFSNNSKGFKKMLKWINGYCRKMGSTKSDWIFCMEHTGLYTTPLCFFLETQKLDFIIEAALRINRSLGLKRGKDDKADSKDIARYAYLHREELKINELPSKDLLRLKNLLAFRARLTKQKNALRTPANELKGFMPPELCQDIIDDTKHLVEQLNEKIRKVEKQMLQIIEENHRIQEVFELATSVKGIGLVIGAYLIVYTNCFTSFSDFRKFSCYIGIAPFSKKSGTSLDVPAKISHLGHKILKALLTNGTMSAIQHDKQLKKYYHRKLKEGKNKYSVLNAVKNKLISRVFATVKRGTPYVELASYT